MKMSWRRIDYIVRMLEDGPLSTRQIYDEFLDNYPKKCPTMYELGMILSRSKMVEKHQEATNQRTVFHNRVYGSKWTGHTVWKISEQVEGVI
jgi:Fe2+ or Zn2+ uptake regulation protein